MSRTWAIRETGARGPSRPSGVARRAAAAAAVALLAVGGAAGCKAQALPAQDGRPPAHGHVRAPLAGAPSTPPAATYRPPSRTSAPSAALPARTPVMAVGESSAQVRELQARLRQMGLFGRNPTGYYGSITAGAVRTFQSRQHLAVTGSVDAVTWAALREVTRQPTAAELRPPTGNPLARPDPRCLNGRVLCISKSSDTLAWMIDGRVISAMDVRFGSQYTPTREGAFSVFFKSRHHRSTIYHTPMPYAMFFSGGQAVHYSADFAARGYAGASHGCVNVRDEPKIAALFAQVRVGDKVVIYH